jgi:hypothetical protein
MAASLSKCFQVFNYFQNLKQAQIIFVQVARVLLRFIYVVLSDLSTSDASKYHTIMNSLTSPALDQLKFWKNGRITV